MVVYDLKCSRDHTFEGWFDGLEDLESQIAQGLVTCPVCGDGQVRRVPSSFGIARGGQKGNEEQAAVFQMLGKAVNRFLKENFDDVGPQFAQEALKIHYGVTEPRNIRGVSTPTEEKMLQDEGVTFYKVGAKAEGEPAAGSGQTDDED